MQVDASDAVLSVTIDPNDSNVVYAGTLSTGVLKSIDGGTSFVAKSSGLPDSFPDVPYRKRTNQSTHTIPTFYMWALRAAACTKARTAPSPWLPINAGLADPNVFGLTSDPGSANGLYASTAVSVFNFFFFFFLKKKNCKKEIDNERT